MEIIFETLKNKNYKLKKGSKKNSKEGGKKGGKKPKSNMALKRDIQTILRQHKVKNMRKHLNHMAGSGLFDSIVGAVSKGVKFYNDNKETIHKVADFAVKHAPKALEVIKKVRGGKRSGGVRSAGKRTLPNALKQWQDKCREYAKKNNCSYKQAMSALKKK